MRRLRELFDRLPERTDDRLYIGIGAQKAGTTWLARYLRAHDEIWNNPLKEMHVFDTLYLGPAEAGLRRAENEITRCQRRVDNARTPRQKAKALERQVAARARAAILYEPTKSRSLARYRSYFESQVPEEFRVYGEVTPRYAVMHETGYAALAKLHPGLRVIFIMREPISRFWSSINMSDNKRPKWWTYEKERGDLLDHARERLSGLRDDTQSYPHTLHMLHRYLPPEQRCTVFYEELFSDGQPALREITEHLGISHVDGEPDQNPNKGQKVPLPDELRAELIEHFQPQVEAVAEHTGRLPAEWTAALDR